tara:strand:- start:57 stop:1001 length:945 start_codon:yes stop_codon:yes gene_type:complete
MILITGFNGFIGNALIGELCKKSKNNIRGTSRAENTTNKKNIDILSTGEINSKTNWNEALKDCTTVIHTAAMTHQMDSGLKEVTLKKYREINTKGTINLANQAARNGVERFIFLSSIKVNGESTPINKPFRFDDIPKPADDYAKSKYEAEVGLKEISDKTGMEIVIIRSPLVYGPGVKANFAFLIKVISKGLPLPLSLVTRNKRSFVSLYNLIDLIITSINHPKAANETFLVSDGKDLSTSELIKIISKIMNKKSRLFPIPIFFLKLFATVLGKTKVVNRLVESLQVDITHTYDILGWKPPLSVNNGIKRTIEN